MSVSVGLGQGAQHPQADGMRDLAQFWRLVEKPETPPGYWAERRSASSESVYEVSVGGSIRVAFTGEKIGEGSKSPGDIISFCCVRDASEVWRKVQAQRVALVRATLDRSLGVRPLIDLCVTFLEHLTPIFLLTQDGIVKEQIETLTKHFGEGELSDLPARPNIPGTVLRRFNLEDDRFKPSLALPVVPIQQRILVPLIKAGEEATLHFCFNERGESLFAEGRWYKSGRWKVQARLDSGKERRFSCDPKDRTWTPFSDCVMRPRNVQAVERDAAEASGSMTLFTFPWIETHELEKACLAQNISFMAMRGFHDRAIAHMQAKESRRSIEENVQAQLGILQEQQGKMLPAAFEQMMQQVDLKSLENHFRTAQQLYNKPFDSALDFPKFRLDPVYWSVTKIIPMSDEATDEEIARAYEEEVLGTSSASSSSSPHSSSSSSSATNSSAAVGDSKAK